MKLSTLINAVKPQQAPHQTMTAGEKDPDISGICYRSDHAAPGYVFAAIKGVHSDGHDFIEDAVSRGAVAILAEKPVNAGAAVIQVSDVRRALAIISDIFFGSPSAHMSLIGITGTNGKTTTAYLLEHILKEKGYKTGVIGTIDCHFNNTVIHGSLTTPESPDIQERLSRMRDAGVTHSIMEVSSHGVAQDRILGCRFSAGVFTNLSQDHLDFHGSMDAYRIAKTRFFTQYIDGHAISVVNCDTPEGLKLAAVLGAERKLTVGSSRACDVRAENASFDQFGISGRIVLPSGFFDFHSPLVGAFNLENILCAIGAAHAVGVDCETMKNAVKTFSTVPGRLERVENSSSRHVFVDYSHTPDALENVLRSLRPIVPGRLICIFGCGGDRDKGKRPMMGAIAANLADIAIVTSDNPRTERPEMIIEDILEGVRQTGKHQVSADRLDSGCRNAYAVIADRSKAIDLGIGISLAGDGILIAGKGHETYQIVGHRTLSFDDRVHAKQALAAYGMT